MRFLVDNQLPTALARWISSTGAYADHVLDLGLEKKSDAELWSFCGSDGRIIVSKDADLILLANRPGDRGRFLWVRIGNCRTATLLARFTAAWPTIEAAFSAGQQIVELR